MVEPTPADEKARADRPRWKSIRDWLAYIPSHSTDGTPRGPGRRATKNFEAFGSSNYIYFCNGRFRTSLHLSRIADTRLRIPVLPITVALTVLPLVLFLVFEARWLWYNVSPAAVVLLLYCWLQTFTNLLKSAFLDAGILPKSIHVVDGLEKNGLPIEYHSWLEFPGPARRGGAPGASVLLKYCDSCYVWRPARAAHCNKCGVCVSNMDHHCPWLSNCLGQRNYWYFFMFLTFAVSTCIFLLALSSYKVSHSGLSNSKLALFLAIYSALCLPYSLLLLVFHVCLGLTGITTREYFGTQRTENNHQLKDVCLNPFNSGSVLHNLTQQWFHGRGRQNVMVRNPYHPNDMRFRQFSIGGLIV